MVTTRGANGISRPCARFSPSPVRTKKTRSRPESKKKGSSRKEGLHTTEELDEATTPTTEDLRRSSKSKAKYSRPTEDTSKAAKRGSKVKESTTLSQRTSSAADKAVHDASTLSKRTAKTRSHKHKKAGLIEGATNGGQHKDQKAPAQSVKSDRGVSGDSTLAESAAQADSKRVRRRLQASPDVKDVPNRRERSSISADSIDIHGPLGPSVSPVGRQPAPVRSSSDEPTRGYPLTRSKSTKKSNISAPHFEIRASSSRLSEPAGRTTTRKQRTGSSTRARTRAATAEAILSPPSTSTVVYDETSTAHPVKQDAASRPETEEKTTDLKADLQATRSTNEKLHTQESQEARKAKSDKASWTGSGKVPYKKPVISSSKRRRRQFQVEDRAFRPKLDLETAEEDSTDDLETLSISKRKRKLKNSDHKSETLDGIWQDESPTSETRSAVHPVRNTRSSAQARRRREAHGGAPPLYTNKLEPPSERGLAQDPVLHTKFATDKDPKGDWHFKHRRSVPSVHSTSRETNIDKQKRPLEEGKPSAWKSHYTDRDGPNTETSQIRETQLQCKLNHVESGAKLEKRRFRREQRDRKAVAKGSRRITSVSFNFTAEQVKAERQKYTINRPRRRSSTTYPALERPAPLIQARKSSSSLSSASTEAPGSPKWETERLSGAEWADKLKYRQTPPPEARGSQSPQSPSTGLLRHYASFMTGALKRHAPTRGNSRATEGAMSRERRSNATEDSITHTMNQGHLSSYEERKSPLLPSKTDESFEKPGSSPSEKTCVPSQHGPISDALEKHGMESLREQSHILDNDVQEESSVRSLTGVSPTIHERKARYSANDGQHDDEHTLESEIHQQLLGELHAEAEKAHPKVATP